jgi:hypothetical protein
MRNILFVARLATCRDASISRLHLFSKYWRNAIWSELHTTFQTVDPKKTRRLRVVGGRAEFSIFFVNQWRLRIALRFPSEDYAGFPQLICIDVRLFLVFIKTWLVRTNSTKILFNCLMQHFALLSERWSAMC